MNKKFLDSVFFPYLKDNNITTLIHLGDLVDRRKYINFNTASRLRSDFLTLLNKMNIDTHIMVGNHDVAYKNTNKINALDELIDDKYSNIKIYTETTEVIFDNLKILLVPWICADNHERSFNTIRETDAQICMGHLELIGFQMYKGTVSTEGYDSKLFGKFDCTFSGHFHHRSSDRNIHYIGAHSEFTWSDYNDPRGFSVFDTETREITFIENPYKIFKKFIYDDTKEIIIPFECSESIIKVIVTNKNDPYLFDNFIDIIEKQNPTELQIVEDHLNLNIEPDDHIIDEAESTIDIFKKYIDKSSAPNLNKEELQKLVVDLYNEAITL